VNKQQNVDSDCCSLHAGEYLFGLIPIIKTFERKKQVGEHHVDAVDQHPQTHVVND